MFTQTLNILAIPGIGAIVYVLVSCTVHSLLSNPQTIHIKVKSVAQSTVMRCDEIVLERVS